MTLTMLCSNFIRSLTSNSYSNPIKIQTKLILEQSVQKIKITDEALIRSYLNTQHSKYFNLLYKRYEKKVYSKCITLLKNEVTAKIFFLKFF